MSNNETITIVGWSITALIQLFILIRQNRAKRSLELELLALPRKIRELDDLRNWMKKTYKLLVNISTRKLTVFNEMGFEDSENEYIEIGSHSDIDAMVSETNLLSLEYFYFEPIVSNWYGDKSKIVIFLNSYFDALIKATEEQDHKIYNMDQDKKSFMNTYRLFEMAISEVDKLINKELK